MVPQVLRGERNAKEPSAWKTPIAPPAVYHGDSRPPASRKRAEKERPRNARTDGNLEACKSWGLRSFFVFFCLTKRGPSLCFGDKFLVRTV